MFTKRDFDVFVPWLRNHASDENSYGMAADAIEELLALLSESVKREQIVRVPTPIGELIARPSDYGSDYPGIWIDLRRDGINQDMAVCLVEYTDTEADLQPEGHLISRVYGNGAKDEYTDRIIIEKIDEFFRTE